MQTAADNLGSTFSKQGGAGGDTGTLRGQADEKVPVVRACRARVGWSTGREGGREGVLLFWRGGQPAPGVWSVCVHMHS